MLIYSMWHVEPLAVVVKKSTYKNYFANLLAGQLGSYQKQNSLPVQKLFPTSSDLR